MTWSWPAVGQCACALATDESAILVYKRELQAVVMSFTVDRNSSGSPLPGPNSQRVYPQQDGKALRWTECPSLPSSMVRCLDTTVTLTSLPSFSQQQCFEAPTTFLAQGSPLSQRPRSHSVRVLSGWQGCAWGPHTLFRSHEWGNAWNVISPSSAVAVANGLHRLLLWICFCDECCHCLQHLEHTNS